MCILCRKSSQNITHYCTWGENEKHFIKKHYEQNPNPDSCICKAHLIEARRMWAIADYTPKWKTSHGTLINTCIVANCQSNTKLVAPKFDTIENIEANIGVKSTPENPLLLCAKHYIAVYRQLNLARPCASCGAMPKQDTYFVHVIHQMPV